MRYDIHFRSDVIDMIEDVVGEIKEWNRGSECSDRDGIEELVKRVVSFDHCAIPDRPFLMGGADGSGGFPCVKYGDSYIYLYAAHGLNRGPCISRKRLWGTLVYQNSLRSSQGSKTRFSRKQNGSACRCRLLSI